MAHSGGVRKKKPKDKSFSKTVILLKIYDQANVSFSDLSRLRSTPEQYKKGIEFASWMTEDDVTKKIKEIFPYLQNKRFSCAALVKLDNDHKKFEFHGSPRVWSGKTIRENITGNSSLYIFELKVSQQTSTDTYNGSNSTDLNQSPSTHNLTPQTNGQSNTISAPLMGSQLPSYPVTKEVSQPSSCTVTHNSILTADSKPSIWSVQPASGQTNTPWDINQAILCQDLELLSSTFQMSHLGDNSAMEVDDDNQQGVSGYNSYTGNPGILPTYGTLNSMQNPVSLITPTSAEQDHSSALSLGERNVTTASQLGLNMMPASSTGNTIAAAPGAQTEVSSKYCSTSGDNFTSGISEGNFDLSEDDLAKDNWTRNADIQLEVSIVPERICLQGGKFCRFYFKPSLPSGVQSGSYATFGHLGTVTLDRLKDSLIGEWIPASSTAGLVTVTVKSQCGVTLGETELEYIDEVKEVMQQIVKDPKLQHSLCSAFELVSSSGSTQPFQVLRLLLYVAAESGAQQFIEIIFNSSAGRVIFDVYKDRCPLPEVIAWNCGHEQTALYLEDINTRFSKEMPAEGPQKIDWSELKAAAEAAQEQHELSVASEERNHQPESDENSDRDYYGDVESDYEDDLSQMLTKVSVKEDESQLEEDALKNDKDENSVQSSLDSLKPQIIKKD